LCLFVLGETLDEFACVNIGGINIQIIF
jgi:hypothetical protein